MDTKSHQVINGSPLLSLVAFLVWVTGGLFFTYLSLYSERISSASDLGFLIGIAAICFVFAIAFLIKTFRNRGPQIFLRLEGFKDRRVSSATIPWNAIDNIGFVKNGMRRPKTMLLYLNSEFWKDINFINSLKVEARLHHGFGSNALYIRSRGLKATFDELVTKTATYQKVAVNAMSPADRTIIATALPEAAVRRLNEITKRVPYGCFAILGVLLFIFTVEGALLPPDESGINLPRQILVSYGGMARSLVDDGEWWRLFTGPLLHGGPLHMLMNGIALVIAGYLLEPLVGWRWFVVTFSMGILFGDAGSYLLHGPDTVTVGASGGILGLFAATIAVAFSHPTAEMRAKLTRRAAFILIPTLLPSVRTTQLHIDFAAHFGGAVGGLLAGILIARLWNKETIAPRGAIVATLASISYVATSGFALALAVRGYEDQKALDPYLPTLFATALKKAPDSIKEYPRDPRLKFVMAVRAVMEGRRAEGEAALEQIENDPEANRLWAPIHVLSEKTLADLKSGATGSVFADSLPKRW